MIQFHYKENGGFYTVTLKTSETAPGTLHKMVKAMFLWVGKLFRETSRQ
ncbi:hypothetical protein LEP1GSC100_2202 [Leptospira interrogans serovar Bataviae str. UI 08561]|nr:hypothetical protein LEP1GSC100_2202 [Leptospira interrogans serovar Bataviae str. UI 08561]